MPRSTKVESEWPTISTAEAVGRLFPYAAEKSTSLDSVIPGCYWHRGEIPNDSTALDRKIHSLIKGEGVRIHDADVLKDYNIHCPYYAWRSWTAASIHHARMTSIANSSGSQNLRKDEARDWENIIKIITRLQKSSENSHLEIGNKSIVPIKHSTIVAEQANKNRLKTIGKLRDLLDDCIDIKSSLESAIRQVDLNRRGNPDIWKMAFYTQMSILWKVTTGASALTEDGPFWKFLDVAIQVISGDEGNEEKNFWSQYKTLEWRLESNSVFEDFDGELIVGSDGFVDDYTSAFHRGSEIRYLSQLAYSNNEEVVHKDLRYDVAAAAIELQGYSRGAYSYVMREIVKEKLEKCGLLNTSLLIQLGWIGKGGPTSVDAALRSILQDAKNGDFIARLVAWLATQCPDMARRLTGMMGGEVLPSVSPAAWADVQRELRHRRDYAPEWHARDGRWKAMIAASYLLTIQGQQPHGGLDQAMMGEPETWDI